LALRFIHRILNGSDLDNLWREISVYSKAKFNLQILSRDAWEIATYFQLLPLYLNFLLLLRESFKPLISVHILFMEYGFLSMVYGNVSSLMIFSRYMQENQYFLEIIKMNFGWCWFKKLMLKYIEITKILRKV